MHYIIDGCLIESELAAKTVYQTNKNIVSFLNSMQQYMNVLDYGCGKLRYAIPISQKVNSVTAIDSVHQINKVQKVSGVLTTIANYAASFSSNIQVFDVESDTWMQRSYDCALLVNVLSAIPYNEVREQVLRNIRNVLNNNCCVLISTQYRNSYFSTYRHRKNAVEFNDGWILKRSERVYSYYGIVDEVKILNLCKSTGLNVISSTKDDGSVFVVARSTRT